MSDLSVELSDGWSTDTDQEQYPTPGTGLVEDGANKCAQQVVEDGANKCAQQDELVQFVSDGDGTRTVHDGGKKAVGHYTNT